MLTNTLACLEAVEEVVVCGLSSVAAGIGSLSKREGGMVGSQASEIAKQLRI
jgi:hypothetical protein